MNGRQPAATDAEGALDFTEKPARPSNSAIIHVAYQGIPVDLTVCDKKIGQIEELIQGLVKRGWTAPPQPRGGFGGKPDTRVAPAYDDGGNEVCPTHKKPLREYTTSDGRKFKGCPSKGEGAGYNAKGFCDLRFK
jgi:hypothetical protein